MNVKRSAARQEIVYVDEMVSRHHILNRDKNKMSICFTSFKHQESQKQIDSPQFPIGA